tara:strand:+ start:120 stop:551 length:432 start_codon:yes stop_codon:yes gene_type:complete
MESPIKVLKEILNRLEVEPNSITTEGDIISLDTSDPALLIGVRGQNILCLECLVKRIVFKQDGTTPEFRLDVNNYRQRQKEFLERIARDGAYRATVLKKSIELRPMSSFERRIVHEELSERKDVNTESKGKGFNRFIVISPGY